MASKTHHQKTHYRIQKPNLKSGHAAFKIQERQKDGRWETLEREDLNAINTRYRAEQATFEITLQKCQAIMAQLYKERDRREPKQVYHTENLRILEDFWKDQYPVRRRRRMEDVDAVYGDYRRAVEAAGNHPLDAVGADELQDYLDEKFEDNVEKQRRICRWLNPILQWLKRDFKLEGFDPQQRPVKYLTLNELTQVIYFTRNPHLKVIALVAWYTGLRKGEIFALTADRVRETYILVDRQLDKKLQTRQTKTKTTRKAIIIPGGLKWVEKWLDIPHEEKIRFRSYKHSTYFKKYCTKAFPATQQEKHCRFHDLRHSYAIYLFSVGIGISQVAQSLGNSEKVCRDYYTGHILDDLALEIMGQMLQKHTKRTNTKIVIDVPRREATKSKPKKKLSKGSA